MGIELVPYSSLSPNGREKASQQSEDGFCLKLRDKNGSFTFFQWYIFYNDQQVIGRIRFTIMHEIAHIVLDHTEASELAEAEANFFAKYALAPPPLVYQFHPEDFLDIAEKFDLSPECAYYAMEFYNKWLQYGGTDFSKEEYLLLGLFSDAIRNY